MRFFAGVGIVFFLTIGEWLMDVPSSNGDLLIWLKHTLGLGLVFWLGIITEKLDQ